MTIPQNHAGIDIAKDQIDLCIQTGDSKRFYTFKTTPDDLRAAMALLGKAQVSLVVLEASGGYERIVETALSDANLTFSRCTPRQVRDFARAIGRLAKTDRIDAEILALYGARMTPPTTSVRPESTRKINQINTRRRQLCLIRGKERTILKGPSMDGLEESLQQHLRWLDAEIKRIETLLSELIRADATLAERQSVLRSMPGIGAVSAVSLMAQMPELGQLNRRQLAALAGLAPLNRDSGNMRGKRTCWGGRSHLRQTLYMAAMTTMRSRCQLGQYFNALIARGKPFKVAMVALMRKMLLTLNAMIKANKHYVAA